MGNCFGSGPSEAASVEELLLKGQTKIGTGLRLEDDYKILSGMLGYGRMATVRTGKEKRTGRKVAIKACSKKVLSTRPARISQVSEIEALQKIWDGLPVSSHVIELYATYEDKSHVHVVMELCTGGDLFHRLAQCDRFVESDAANICHQLLLAVQHCHRHLVVHRDLKPENILVASEQGLDIKLVDFGSAAILVGAEDVLHDFMATPFYAAPEVWLHRYGKQCDIWSIGALLYVLITGLPPSLNSSLVHTYPAWVCLQKGIVTGLPDSTSPALQDLLEGLLNPDPSRRITLEEALAHPWIAGIAPRSQANLEGSLRNFRAFSRARQFQKAAVALLLVSLNERRAQELISRVRTEASQHHSVPTTSPSKRKAIAAAATSGQSMTTNASGLLRSARAGRANGDLGTEAAGGGARDEGPEHMTVGSGRLESTLREMGQVVVAEQLAEIRVRIYAREEERDHPEILLEDYVSILSCRGVPLPNSRRWGQAALQRAHNSLSEISHIFSPSRNSQDPTTLPPLPARTPSTNGARMGPKGWSSPNLSSLDRAATPERQGTRFGVPSSSPEQILENQVAVIGEGRGSLSPLPSFDMSGMHSTVHGEMIFHHLVQLQKVEKQLKY